jgi:DNA primase
VGTRPQDLPDALYKFDYGKEPGAVVFIAEGEKCVETLLEIGVNATCSVGGAGKWREQFNESFRDLNVIILPDNDTVGKIHAATVSDNLKGVARTVAQFLKSQGLTLKATWWTGMKSNQIEVLLSSTLTELAAL